MRIDLAFCSCSLKSLYEMWRVYGNFESTFTTSYNSILSWAIRCDFLRAKYRLWSYQSLICSVVSLLGLFAYCHYQQSELALKDCK